MAVEISDWNDLRAVDNDLSGDYELVNNLDSDTDGYDEIASESANDGEGFRPIGWDEDNKSGDESFTGTFDGQGYVIKDVTIDVPDGSQVGLFYRLNGPSIVEDLGLINWDITAEQRAGVLTAGLWNDLTDDQPIEVRRIFVEGSVDTTADDKTGGLTGRSQPRSDADPDGDHKYTDCFAFVDVDGPSGEPHGGFVGESSSDTGVDNENLYENCYSAGSVPDSNGFMGDDNRNNVNQGGIYFDEDLAGTTDDPFATGLNTSEMVGDSATDNMSEYDFSNTWKVIEEDSSFTEDDTEYTILEDGHPVLQAVSTTAQLDGQEVNYEEVIDGPQISTLEASSIGFDDATLNGELTDLGEESEVDVFFEWRETGETSWNETTKVERTSTGTFDETISDLDDDTEYEFRAVVEWDEDGSTEKREGSTLTFTTEESNPVFDVTITNTNTPVNQSETLQVSVDVTNTGNDDGEKDVWLEYDTEGNEVDREENLQVEPSETESLTLTHSIPSDEDPDDYTIWVKTEDDTETETVTIQDFTDVEFDIKNPVNGSTVRSTNVRCECEVTVNDDDINGDLEIRVREEGSQDFETEFVDPGAVTGEGTYTIDEVLEFDRNKFKEIKYGLNEDEG